VTLSGGQRQRVEIARALLMDPRVLILDDSTSSVDTETEHEIQEALAHLMLGRSTLVIAQRVSSIINADHILVLDRGKVVERGRHEDLLEQGGLYAQTFALQQQQASLTVPEPLGTGIDGADAFEERDSLRERTAPEGSAE
jgi:ATP-binding cassette subfamily B protein